MELELKTMETDVLIIGGGTAGCFCALTIAENSQSNVIIVDKANIKRSGCLAAGVNALNAYITDDETPESFVDYVKKDSEEIIREDLVLSIAKRLNQVTEKIERMGLPILKDKEGNYVSRGKRSIKINGESIKPILASEVYKYEQISVLNKVNIIDYLIKDGEIIGAVGFAVEKNVVLSIYAKAVVCATGGAAGLYKPNNPEFSRHKMWYSPFNTGAGYAMGIRAGAEMTSFEMRFIALRCKDTIAPTGTIAQGIGAEQINGRGQPYVEKYGKPTTATRLYSTIMENSVGMGPCYLQTKGISNGVEEQLYKAYLNMAPAQTLKWMENNKGPSKENVEIQGTEPYIVGGHTGSGYWVDINRKTTLKGLYAIGDVAGGSPKKYVTGCFAEGEIAGLSAIEFIKDRQIKELEEHEIMRHRNFIRSFFNKDNESLYSIEEVEIAMQKIMDEYAGGISTNYKYNEIGLKIATERILELQILTENLKANNLFELTAIFELIDRLYVCKVLIHHLKDRKETRWRCYQENSDYPKQDVDWCKYLNSKYEDGEIKTFTRRLIRRDEIYEH